MEGLKFFVRNSYLSFLNFLDMIKFEHTIFALPFAYMGMFMASEGLPTFKQFMLITIAFVTARTYAMTLNRIIDLSFDRLNPRTKDRPLVTGKVKKKTAFIGLFLSLTVFSTTSYALGPLVFKLMPVAIFFLTIYHLTKRFTYLSHFVLGFTDGLAPLGAWVAIKNSVFSHSDTPGWLLLFIVTFWIAGFDILYQSQDAEFDKKMGLHSIPARFGIRTALNVSRFCHLLMLFGLILLIQFLPYRLPFLISLFITVFLLIKEHRMIKPDDLSKLNVAFFNMNGYISVVIFFGIIFSILA
ncbi:MAG: putative 4-hydroxybenzoate polyprenyltransferase [Deltaproteobacteria bacterium]|nr:putative 4-hydroxybenzoate polyprenyltransferase [Deltaproteobacteria bacterium]